MKNKTIFFLLPLLAFTPFIIAMLLGPGTTDTSQKEYRTYTHAQYGISFAYPASYELQEMQEDSAGRALHTLVLVDKRALAEARSKPGGEGPVSITIAIFRNEPERLSLHGFVAGTQESLYMLPPEHPYASTTVAGREALVYPWEGLYNGKSVVFAHQSNIIMVSVSFMSPEDPIIADFERLVATLELQTSQVLNEAEAIAVVVAANPELADYLSPRLPPTFIRSAQDASGWHLAFETHGSGIPYVLAATCFHITHAREVKRRGAYMHPKRGPGARHLSPETCQPIL